MDRGSSSPSSSATSRFAPIIVQKGSIFDDAVDDKEYEGNLIYLLKSGTEFVRNNSKVRFEKKAQYRVDKPDYSERAVTEALVNALIHRDYLVILADSLIQN